MAQTIALFTSQAFPAGHYESAQQTVPPGVTDAQLTYSIVSMPNATDVATVVAWRSTDGGATFQEIARSENHGGTIVRNGQPRSGPVTGSLGVPVVPGWLVRLTLDVVGSTLTMRASVVLS